MKAEKNHRYISISSQRGKNQRAIYSHSIFFDNDIITKITDDKIIFSHPSIDWNGRICKPTKITRKRAKATFAFTITGELPLGKFEFDEAESSEDCIVVYYSKND